MKQEEKKSKSSKLRVTCTDGKVIQFQYAWQTFAEVIKKVGVEKVMQMEQSNRGLPLISKERFPDTAKSKYQKEIEHGVFLYIKSSTNDKYVEIERIRKDCKIEWIENVEIV